MKPNRAPGRVWALRRDLGNYVCTQNDERIFIQLWDGSCLSVPRADARLLAKRINQCLDGTAKR